MFPVAKELQSRLLLFDNEKMLLFLPVVYFLHFTRAVSMASGVYHEWITLYGYYNQISNLTCIQIPCSNYDSAGKWE